MLARIRRLFTIQTRWEAYAVIYALALGATTRGFHYLEAYPGAGGYLLFLACTVAVFMAGAKILDGTPKRRRDSERRRLDRIDRRFPAVGLAAAASRRATRRRSVRLQHVEGSFAFSVARDRNLPAQRDGQSRA